MSTEWHKGQVMYPRDPLSKDHWILPGVPVEKFRTFPSGLTFVDDMYTLHGGTHSDIQHYENTGVGRHEYMSGFNHRNWNAYMRFNRQDVGGEWLKRDLLCTSPGSYVGSKFPVSPGWYSYGANNLFTCQDVADIVSRQKTGDMASDSSWIGSLTPTKLTDGEMDQFGTMAIALVEPTNPATDLSSALGELLRDGLPSLPGKADGNIGSEYLNLQFGWSPTIRDGKDFIKAIRNTDVTAKQYVRDSGRMIRRRFGPLREGGVFSTTTTGVQPAGISGHIPTVHSISTGTLTKSTVWTKDIWFSGAFAYYLPDNALGLDIATLDRTYGLIPDFETGWNLTPWSWLVDWFSNAKFVIHNLDAFSVHGLTMPFGYVMCDQQQITTLNWVGSVNWEGTWYPLELNDSVISRTRQRRQANPFGFGVSWEGLDPFQISILAALGISRR